MKSKIALVVLGFAFAFGLSWYPSRTVFASSNTDSRAARTVTLVCNGFTANLCTDLEQVAPDGTLTPYQVPASGTVLVVTDFTWKAANVPPGQVAFATIHHQLTSPPHDVVFSTAVATPDSASVSEVHVHTGLLFSDMPIVFVSNTPNVAIVQGYLAKDDQGATDNND